MKILSAVATVLLLATSLNGCSSSSSAQIPGMQGTTLILDNADHIAVLNSGRAVFTSYDSGTAFEVWSTDFTDEGTVQLLTDALVVPISGDVGMVWRGRAIIRSQFGPGGGLFWLSDGTVAGTVPFFDISDPVLDTEVVSVAREGDILVIEAFYFVPGPSPDIETRLIRVNLLAPNS